MKRSTTKRALWLSVLSMFLCLTMFMGTTFAWFTDEVTSGTNTIVAGNLDVELYNAIGVDANNKVDTNTKLFELEAPNLWEPGAVVYENLTVANHGNLALQYQLTTKITNQQGSKSLADVLKIAVVEGGFTGDREAAKALTNYQDFKTFVLDGKLLAGTAGNPTTETYGLVIYWEPSANDNDYNMNKGEAALSIDIGVHLFATQLGNESDSFDNTYDGEAGGAFSTLTQNSFSNASDLNAFDPTPNDGQDNSGLSLTNDGKAQVDASGATNTNTMNLIETEQSISYDMDISDMTSGQSITVEAGNSNNSYIFERGSTKIYWGANKEEYVGTLEGTNITVEHIYSVNAEGQLQIVTVFSDGKDTLTHTYTEAVAEPEAVEMTWKIADVTEAGKVTLDDFTHEQKGATIDSEIELEAVLAKGGEVILAGNIVSENGFTVSKDIVIDLNGKTLTATGDRAYLFTVEGDADLTLVGGKLVAESTNHMLNGTGTSTGASSSVYFESTGTLIMTDVEVQASVRGGHRAIDVYGGNAVLTNVDIVSYYGSGVNAGSDASVVLNDCDITVNGMYSAPYNSVCFSVMYGGELTINSGNYKLINDAVYATGDTHGGWVGIVMNSGGTITTNGGTFTNVPAEGFKPQYERAIIEAENLDPATATVNLLGGTFIPQKDNVVSGYGDVNYPVINAYLIDNGDGTWTAVPKIDGVTLTAVANYPHLYTDGTNYYVYDAEGLISMNNFWKANWIANNMWGCSYNVMADIDATGYTWNEAYVIVGSNDNNGFVFDGHDHTITGLTINGGLFSGTPNGSQKPEAPGYVKNITFDGVKVVGGHWAGVLWSNIYNDLVVQNVSVINSEITGKCNVAALVGGTVIDGAPDASVSFIDCVVENNVITATGTFSGEVGDWYSDPTGASIYLSRAFGNTNISFENCTSEGNTVNNGNGLVGGGIYGYTALSNGWWAGTGVCDTFTNWGGLTIVSENTATGLSSAIESANGGTVSLSGTVDLGGTQGNYLTLTEDITVVGGAIKGTGWTGELNYAVNATSGNIVFDGVTFDTTDWTTVGWANWGISVNVNGNANVTFKNCTFKGGQCPIYQSGADSVIILENCKFETTTAAIQCEIYSGDFSLGQDLIVKDCDFTGVADVLHIYDYDKDPTSEAIVEYLTNNGNTFTGVCKQTCK